MPDREKVIERLEYCAETRDVYVRDCINDAITLLKEQEAVEPIIEGNEHIHVFRCRKCNRILQRNNEMDYCPKCGQPIKWQ